MTNAEENFLQALLKLMKVAQKAFGVNHPHNQA